MGTERHSHADGPAKMGLDRSDPEHEFADPAALDFDPDDGLYSGTAVDGTSQIPGPHVDTESGELTDSDEPRAE